MMSSRERRSGVVTNEQLIEVEEFASYFFTIEEVSKITGITDTTSRAFKDAYDKGKLKSEAELRKAIIQTAKDGSSPAQTMAYKMLEKLDRTQY